MSPPAAGAVAAVLLLLAGCVSASAVRLGERGFGPRSDTHPIAVYDALGDVTRRYVKVARVVGEGSDSVAFSTIVERMCGEARRHGADALVLTGGGLLLSSDGDCGTSVDRAVTGLALRWD